MLGCILVAAGVLFDEAGTQTLSQFDALCVGSVIGSLLTMGVALALLKRVH